MGGEGAQALSPDGITPGSAVPGGAVPTYHLGGLSDRLFSDVADLFLAHPSILPANGIQMTYAGKRLFPDRLFVNVGPVSWYLYTEIDAILLEIGNNIMTGVDYGQFCGVTSERLMLVFSNQAAAWAAIVNVLWRAACQLVILLEGPAEFTPTVHHLRDVKPVFGPSLKYAQFLRDATGLDATAAVDAANEILPRYFQPIQRSFPRMQHLEEQLTSEL